MNTVHQSKVGTFHPAPHQGSFVEAWTIHDSRGTIDSGPLCDECGACDCNTHQACPYDDPRAEAVWESSCSGLSFAYICLDGGESLCRDCAEKAGIQIVPCDCK